MTRLSWTSTRMPSAFFVIALSAVVLFAVGLALPVVPQAGTVEIDFDAGHGANWSDVPEDLARAVILLAADFYDNRAIRDAIGWPSPVLALVERFRKLRLGAAL